MRKVITAASSLIALLVVSVFLALNSGSVKIDFAEILKYLTGGGAGVPGYDVIMQIRLPRIILAMLVGGMLGVAGAILQGVLKNPLVDPYITGISSGAALGASIAIVTGFSGLIAPSIAGAVLTLLLVYRMSIKNGRVNITYLLLSGVMIGSLFSSVIMLVSTAYNRDLVKVIFWLMGDLSNGDPLYIKYTILFLSVVMAVAIYFSNDLNILALSEDEAKTVGVNPELIKSIYFIIAGLLTGLSVALSGVIGFVGLIIPHIIRFIIGPDMRALLPCSFLAGAVFLLLADTAARTLFLPSEIPVGILTGIIGAPLFLFLLLRKEK